jgi:hypothetical protein
VLTLYNSDGSVNNVFNYARGAAREANAVTILGARLSGASRLNYFDTLFPDIKINGNYYPLDAKGQAIQLAQPDNGNPLTLFNTVPEQWEQVPCSIRDDGRLTPTITEQPQNLTVATGSVATFSTLATVPEGEVSYQWQEDNGAGFTDIAAATEPTLNLGIVTALANGKLVRARVTANGRSVLSITVTLTVTL